MSELLAGRYERLGLLGRGASGTTWRGRDVQTGRVVAIKDMPLPMGEKARALIHREAEVLRQLNHPGIPRYLDHHITEGPHGHTLSLVMELVEGQTLEERTLAHRFTADEVTQVLLELGDVLEYLHDLSPPVVHRDIKPSNVIRRSNWRLALIDFGAVRDHLTLLGGSTVAGTFGYMAPEQFAGDAAPASDLYGMGALAVHLLTRRDPRTLLDHANRMGWRPHADVEPLLGAVLDRLVEPDLSVRIASVAELRAALTGPIPAPTAEQPPLPAPDPVVLATPELHPEAVPFKQPVPPPLVDEPYEDDHALEERIPAGVAGRSSLTWAALGAILVLLLAGLGLALVAWRPGPPPTPPLIDQPGDNPDVSIPPFEDPFIDRTDRTTDEIAALEALQQSEALNRCLQTYRELNPGNFGYVIEIDLRRDGGVKEVRTRAVEPAGTLGACVDGAVRGTGMPPGARDTTLVLRGGKSDLTD